MSIQKIMCIGQALTSIEGLKVTHGNGESNAPLPYCVWYEDGEVSSLEVNNHKVEQAIGGYVDYYTKTECDPICDSIQDALNSIENCSWSYESVIYGDPTFETKTIHHTWAWGLR